MSIITYILVAFGLAMDASAVSVAGGAGTKRGMETALLAALFFGSFQAAMFAVGGFGGEALKSAVEGMDHWLAFILLGTVGGRMVIESARRDDARRIDLLDPRVLTVLAVATSIDALVAGAGIALGDGSVLDAAVVVGAVTAAISFISVLIGKRYGVGLGKWVETAGGIVLITIGAGILMAHTFAG